MGLPININTKTQWVYTYGGRFQEYWNAESIPDPYPLPRIDDLFEQVGKAKYLIKLDASKWYWAVPMEEESIPYPAFVTPHGHFEWRYMAFGLRTGFSTYQRLMHTLFKGCATFARSYLDDIVISSELWEDHKHFEIVFKHIRDAQLKLNKNKCTFGSATIEYLGHKVVLNKIETERSR